MPIKVQESRKTPDRKTPEKEFYRTPINQNTKCTKQKKGILKVSREKNQVTYKGRYIRIIPDFVMETLET